MSDTLPIYQCGATHTYNFFDGPIKEATSNLKSAEHIRAKRDWKIFEAVQFARSAVLGRASEHQFKRNVPAKRNGWLSKEVNKYHPEG